MNDINPLETAIQEDPQMESHVRDAAIEFADRLDLCWKAAQAVFEDKCKPEHAVQLLPLFMAVVDEKRQLQSPQNPGSTGAE